MSPTMRTTREHKEVATLSQQAAALETPAHAAALVGFKLAQPRPRKPSLQGAADSGYEQGQCTVPGATLDQPLAALEMPSPTPALVGFSLAQPGPQKASLKGASDGGIVGRPYVPTPSAFDLARKAVLSLRKEEPESEPKPKKKFGFKDLVKQAGAAGLIPTSFSPDVKTVLESEEELNAMPLLLQGNEEHYTDAAKADHAYEELYRGQQQEKPQDLAAR